MNRKIRTRRHALGLSVRKVCKQAGISERMGWRIEEGHSVGLKYLKAYVEALGGSITVVFPSESDNET